MSKHETFDTVKAIAMDLISVKGEHGGGKVPYYIVHRRKGYNCTDYVLYRVWGKPAPSENIVEALGGNPYCGGGLFSPNPEELGLGETFGATIWGCD